MTKDNEPIILPPPRIHKIEDRVKSRLGGMPRVLFSPCNATQMNQILKKRVAVPFNESVFESTVIPKIAAIAAYEH